MNSNRKTAMVAGTLFIIAAVTAIAGLIMYDPILNDSDYITKANTNEPQVLWGVFFEIILAFSVIGTSITLFPVLKKYNESLAIGTVCFRVLEATLIIIGILSLLTIVTLNHSFLNENNPNISAYLIASKLLLAIHNWTFLYGPNLALGPSTLMTGYLLYKSQLVPRSVSILGIIGGSLISVCALLVTFGAFNQLSFWGMLLAVPVFIYEMSLAVWLLIKGFNSISTFSDTQKEVIQFGRD